MFCSSAIMIPLPADVEQVDTGLSDLVQRAQDTGTLSLPGSETAQAGAQLRGIDVHPTLPSDLGPTGHAGEHDHVRVAAGITVRSTHEPPTSRAATSAKVAASAG